MATITVLGAGMMGSALCVPLVDAGHDVRLVGTHFDGEIIESVTKTGVHPKLKLPLPSAIRPFFVEQLAEAMRGVDAVGIGVSSAGVRWAGQQLRPFVQPGLPIVMITKGLELAGGHLDVLPDVLAQELGSQGEPSIAPVAVAGPCIAGELARRVETCVVFTGRETQALEELATLCQTRYYHVWTSPDVVGIESCAALKNAYAMGIGFAAGLHEAAGGAPGSVALHNYEAAVFAQAVREMQRIVMLLGGNPASAAGLAGVGDLNVTCNGGRTGRFGRQLGLGIGVKRAIEAMQGATLECLEILDVMRQALHVYEARRVLGSDELPLLRHLMAVALDDKPIAMPFSDFFSGRS
jgi:glycerol-3-phosphate dehydrogenase (NAD(P)+)